MSSGSWKVAYADFMTAMMAFFLLMWLLNATTDEQKAGLADYFTADATGQVNISSPIGPMSATQRQYVSKLDTREFNVQDIKKTHIAIVQALKESIEENMKLSTVAGQPVEERVDGVMLELTPSLLFKSGSVELNPAGLKILDDVVTIMDKYKVYLIVRGHASKGEFSAEYPTPWDLASARANNAVSYLIDHGANEKLIRSISYGDTAPKVPANLPGAAERNNRIEFYFHRPEVMSTIMGF